MKSIKGLLPALGLCGVVLFIINWLIAQWINQNGLMGQGDHLVNGAAFYTALVQLGVLSVLAILPVRIHGAIIGMITAAIAMIMMRIMMLGHF